MSNIEKNKTSDDICLSDNPKDLRAIIKLLTGSDTKENEQKVTFTISPALVDILNGLNDKEAAEVFKTILNWSSEDHINTQNNLLELLIFQLRPVFSEKSVPKNSKYPWSSMAIGDSFTVKGYSARKQGSLGTIGKGWFSRNKPHAKIITRREGDSIVVSRIQ